MRAPSWFAICCATSSFPPLRKYSVMPVARVWQPIFVSLPAPSDHAVNVGLAHRFFVSCPCEKGNYLVAAKDLFQVGNDVP